jgi:hypothetical protein
MPYNTNLIQSKAVTGQTNIEVLEASIQLAERLRLFTEFTKKNLPRVIPLIALHFSYDQVLLGYIESHQMSDCPNDLRSTPPY